MARDQNAGPGDIQKRITDWITAGATIVAALSLVVAANAYLDQERTGRLTRTLEFLTAANAEPDEADRRAILEAFPHRWQQAMPIPVTKEEAESFFQISIKPDKSPTYEKWNAARKHLNNLESLAFAYVHDLADDKILAAAICLNMTRSNEYFKELIDRFGREFPGHPWQVIPQAVRLMESRYGSRCKGLLG